MIRITACRVTAAAAATPGATHCVNGILALQSPPCRIPLASINVTEKEIEGIRADFEVHNFRQLGIVQVLSVQLAHQYKGPLKWFKRRPLGSQTGGISQRVS